MSKTKEKNIQIVRDSIRDIPDFPKPGIIFKDITTVLNEPLALQVTLDLLFDELKDREIDFIASVESRGFIFGVGLAARLGAGFVPIRKPGKLPGKTISENYELEYGYDTVELHEDAFASRARKKVLLIDDLLATGGTAGASINLIKKAGGDPVGAAFVIELAFLEGRKKLPDGLDIISLVEY